MRTKLMSQEKQLSNNDLLLEEGVKNKYISFNEDKTRITYHIKEEKNYKYTDPEEQVRAIAVLRLIMHYQYDPKDIALEVIVPRRTPKDLADIMVYNKGNDKSLISVWSVKKTVSQIVSLAKPLSKFLVMLIVLILNTHG